MNLQWWPLYGLKRKLTERAAYMSPVKPRQPASGIFNRSLFVYILDVGSCNGLNFEIAALESPQYNIHRFGIYITDSPRHADVLLILGRPADLMHEPMKETISQLSNPFHIITIDDYPEENFTSGSYPELPNHVAALKGTPSPSEILGLLLDIAKTKRKRS